MLKYFDNFFTSGHQFNESQLELKSRYQIINITIILSFLGLLFGISVNIINGIHGYVLIESIILFTDVILLFMLRYYKKAFDFVCMVVSAQFAFLFLFLIYVGEPNELKHIWILTYPILLLYFHNDKSAVLWLVIIFTLLLIAPIQPFIEVKYSMFQVFYIAVVLFIVSLIIYFYQVKIHEARDVILEQQILLRNFNINLEHQVIEKTSELQKLNESLENMVQEKVDELINKDKILTKQSKQAVMGEMISMIAHQWRQPLSTITLQISDLQVKKLLGNKIDTDEFDKALSRISDTIIYLSDTIDDFQTYFQPDREMSSCNIIELFDKVLVLVTARVEEYGVEINIDCDQNIFITTHINELIQVILNILNNAMDAMLEDKIEYPRIDISVKSDKESIYIDIADNANGILEQNMKKLFEPYFSTKGKNGTGLGLYMCQMIVQKQLNGEILVKSSTNGSIFTIKLPVNI